MELSNYSSRTAEVKAIIASFMADKEEPVERREIAEYVLDHVTTDVTDGVIAGAIKIMASSGEIYPVSRGRYIRGTGKAKATAFEKIYNICKRFDCDLERGCTFNALELTDAERSVYGEFCDCALELRNYVREKAADMAAILEKVHGVETGEAFFGASSMKSSRSIHSSRVGTSGRSSVPDIRAGYRKLGYSFGGAVRA